MVTSWEAIVTQNSRYPKWVARNPGNPWEDSTGSLAKRKRISGFSVISLHASCHNAEMCYEYTLKPNILFGGRARADWIWCVGIVVVSLQGSVPHFLHLNLLFLRRERGRAATRRQKKRNKTHRHFLLFLSEPSWTATWGRSRLECLLRTHTYATCE